MINHQEALEPTSIPNGAAKAATTFATGRARVDQYQLVFEGLDSCIHNSDSKDDEDLDLGDQELES